MAIMRKKVMAQSTHFPNLEKRAPEDAAAEVLNNQEANILSYPEDMEGGSTHFLNDQPNTKATRRLNAKKIGANLLSDPDVFHGDDPDATEGPDEDEFTGIDEDSGVEAAMQDTQHMDNDLDPAAGYLTVGGEFEDEDEDIEDDDMIEASEFALEDNAGSNPASVLEVPDTEDWDTDEKVIQAKDVNLQYEEEHGVDSALLTEDDIPLVDIDEMDDKENQDVVFASVGVRLHAIKAGRIIATLTKAMATNIGHGDVYMSDQFQDVVGIEMAKRGVRAGLKNMGFALATVNMAKKELINKRVEAKVQQVTAAIRRNSQINNEAFEQCAAIAAVGINRQYFKDTRNELRSALEEELQNAGVRGASRLVRKVFASHGVSYAKAIITLATKLKNMPEETRNALAEALDMTTEDDLDDTDLYGDNASPDFQAEYAAGSEEDDADFADEFEDEIESPNTVQAALLRPLKKSRVSASRTNYSPIVRAILDGDRY